MYEYLKGIITKITAKYIVLEANGIGYMQDITDTICLKDNIFSSNFGNNTL